jgi:hypothetical protein
VLGSDVAADITAIGTVLAEAIGTVVDAPPEGGDQDTPCHCQLL